MTADPAFEVHERAAATAPSAAEFAHFSSIEGLQEASEAEGWSINYSQIQAGRVTLTTSSRNYGGFSLMDETADRRMEVFGETPAGHLTVMAPCDGRMWINGLIVDPGGIAVFDAGKEALFVTSENIRGLSMHIPVPLLDSTTHNVRSHILSSRLSTPAIQFEAAAAKRLRQRMHALIYRQGSTSWQKEQIDELLTSLVRRTNHSIGHSYEHCQNPRSNAAMRVIARARDYIESHLDQALPMSNVCAYAAVSLSKLERTFMKELGFTPHAYVRARRLAAVRRELQNTSPEQRRVADAAMDYGFYHLGRFSGAYRQQFGELPSETLRAT